MRTPYDDIHGRRIDRQPYHSQRSANRGIKLIAANRRAHAPRPPGAAFQRFANLRACAVILELGELVGGLVGVSHHAPVRRNERDANAEHGARGVGESVRVLAHGPVDRNESCLSFQTVLHESLDRVAHSVVTQRDDEKDEREQQRQRA